MCERMCTQFRLHFRSSACDGVDDAVDKKL